MIVKNILQNKARGAGVVSVDPDVTITAAAQMLAQHRIGALIVLGVDGAIVGILSERDIIRGLAESTTACLALKVRDLMTAQVLTCREQDTIDSVMATMTNRRFRHLPVLDNFGTLIGMITIGDVVKSSLDSAHQDVESMRRYVAAG